jgi:hypothetical protein
MITWIAIGNAVLWSGVILFLLFRAMRNQRDLEERIDRLEHQIKPEWPEHSG